MTVSLALSMHGKQYNKYRLMNESALTCLVIPVYQSVIDIKIKDESKWIKVLPLCILVWQAGSHYQMKSHYLLI